MIDERVSVVAVFQNGKMRPAKFFWRGREYIVDKINLEHRERCGNGVILCFSVLAAQNCYSLEFDSLNLSWRLLETEI